MNIFKVPSHGQPLLARQNKSFYFILVIAAIIIAIFFLIKYILKLVKNKTQTKEWKEAQKKKITTKENVEALATKINLTKEETQFLWNICKKNKLPNIFYLSEDATAIDEIFKTEYKSMITSNEEAEKILMLFRLRHKIDQEIALGVSIKTTNALAEETRFDCCLESGEQIPCILRKKTAEGLLLEIPQKFYDSSDRPAELSKALFTFNYPSITRYEFLSRIVRYEISLNKKPGMFITHSKDLKISVKRNSRRINYLQNTVFYAAQIIDETTPNKFIKKEKSYDCMILNISGGGCCISSSLPIKQNQFIALDIPINEKTINAIGKIVDTRRLDQNKFALHIAFAEISPQDQIEIFALTYGYD